MKAIEDAEVLAQKKALDAINREMAANSASTLGEKILQARKARGGSSE